MISKWIRRLGREKLKDRDDNQIDSIEAPTSDQTQSLPPALHNTPVPSNTNGASEDLQALDKTRHVGEIQAGLVRIAHIAVSTLNLYELISRMMDETVNMLDAEKGALLLWDEMQQELTVHPAGVVGMKPDHLVNFRLRANDLTPDSNIFESKQPFISDDACHDQRISADYRPLIECLNAKTLLAVPLTLQTQTIGELYVVNKTTSFTQEDAAFLTAIAAYMAAAIQNARLFSRADQRLHHRVEELTGLQRVSQELNSTLDQKRILGLVLQEAVRATGADAGNVSLCDRNTGQILAWSDFGFSDNERNHLQDSMFYTGPSLMGRAMKSGETTLASDISVVPNCELVSDESRSAVAAPISYIGDVTGVINLESRRVQAFSENRLRYLETLANQAAIAIRNTLAFEEQRQQRELLRQRANQLARLSEISRAFRSDQPLESVLEDIAYAIQESLRFNVVLVGVMRGEPPRLHWVAGAGVPLANMERLTAEPQPPESVIDLMQDRFRLGIQSYYIPRRYKGIWEDRFNVYQSQAESRPAAPTEKPWQPGDLCLSPLYNLERQLIGLLCVDAPRNGQVPKEEVLETLEIFANQAAAAIENTLLFSSEQKRRRLADTLRQVAEVVSSTLDSDQVMTTLLDQLQHIVPYDSASVQVLRGDQLIITGGRGWDNPQDVLGIPFSVTGDNPNSVVVRQKAPYIVPNVQETYTDFREPPHNHIRSWLGVPLLFGGNLLGMITLDSVRPNFYTQEHAQLALTFANQAAVALQNAQLFEQVQQHADRLRVINEVGVEISSILNVDELIARVSQLVEDNFGYQVNINLVEEELIGWDFAPGKESKVPTAPPAKLRRPYPAPEVERRVDYSEYSEIVIPLKMQEHIIGLFEVRVDAPGAFTENEVLLLQSLAGQTAVAIANAQLFQRVSRLGQELEQRVQERTEALAKTLEELTLERDRVEALYCISRELSASLDLDRVLMEALNLINRAVGVSHGSIMLLDSGTGMLINRAALGRVRGLPRGGKPTRYSRGVGLAGWVLEARESVIIPDVTQDPRWLPSEHEPEPGRKSALAVPLASGDDVVGVLLLFHPEVNYFSQDHLRLVNAAAAQVTTAINNAELYQLITDQAERLGVMLRTQQAEAAKHQAIVEGIADGVLVLDANYRIVLMNPAAARILGVDAGAFEGRHIRNILGKAESNVDQILTQQLYDELMGGVEHFTVAESPDDIEETSTNFRLKAENKVVVGNVSLVSLASGELPSLVTVLRDISREAEVDRLKDEFISTVSHELRTPMTSIKGYTDLLAGKKIGPLNEQQERFVQVIKINADRLTALVNDILDISRIETGRIKLDIKPLDMIELINRVADSIRGQMVEKSLELKLDIPRRLPLVRGDENRVTQVLENLTSNAWKYTPEGGRVTIRARELNGVLQVDVSDTGIGIEAKDLNRIFDRFYRTEQAIVHAVSGTGLGLSIVQMFVELLGGEIWVESRINQGTTFSFTLPVVLPTQKRPPLADETAPKILVVDDDEHTVDLLKHHLEIEGYQVLTAQRGEDVLPVARSEKPNLITLDIILGDMDGFEVLESLKNDPSTATIPVVIVSVVPDAKARGLALGAASFISKPFDEQQVVGRVRAVLSSLDSDGSKRLNRILVVDDDHDIVNWLREALTSSGFTVLGAYNGREALVLAREDTPDLIILDLRMPDMDGYEVIRNLRSDPATDAVPVIVITGSPLDNDDHVRVLGAEVEQLLTKPFTIETLIEEIKQVGYEMVAN